MRKFETLATATVLSVITTAALADARTIRIEPRPYTSVVVTVENGVRVWRPMPPTELVIVNPGNKASINLEIDAKSHRDNRNYNFHQGH
jgi:hypothetical protein